MRRRRRWFLPDPPDVLALLRVQTGVTVRGLEALLAWAEGDPAAADRVRVLEHEADERKRELRRALTQMLAPPLDPEDLFTLSEGVDEVLNHAKNTVREAELMGVAPDEAIAEMAACLVRGASCLDEAFGVVARPADAEAAKAAADRAIKTQRDVEHVYRRAMSALLDVEDLSHVTARRELYRRLVRTSDEIAAVAERVWYAVLKRT
jgi:uncharacterized protein Yka (UPF0111/DUF47 family)